MTPSRNPTLTFMRALVGVVVSFQSDSVSENKYYTKSIKNISLYNFVYC